MSKIQKIKAGLKKFSPAALGVGLASSASSSFAIDLTGSITTAVTDGTTNVSAAATGIIAIAAIMLGVGIVVAVLKR